MLSVNAECQSFPACRAGTIYQYYSITIFGCLDCTAAQWHTLARINRSGQAIIVINLS